MPHLAHITLVVRDYDEALAFYVGRLGFDLVEDSYQPEQDKRWVVIRPPGAGPNATTILLARAANDHQQIRIGDQTSGRVGFFLTTDDFERDHARFTAAGTAWVRSPPARLRLYYPPPPLIGKGASAHTHSAAAASASDRAG